MIPEKFAEPMMALMQLLTIREKEYTKGWEPDWDTTESVYAINVNKFGNYWVAGSLTFPSEELRDEFCKNWKDLIEIAKPLL